MSPSLKTVLLILKIQYSLTRNEKTHLLWKFVRDLRDLSSDLKENCVLNIIVKNLRFSIISIKMVHIYCKYQKNAFIHDKNVQKVRRVYEQLRCAYELTYAPFMSPTLGWDLFHRVLLSCDQLGHLKIWRRNFIPSSMMVWSGWKL